MSQSGGAFGDEEREKRLGDREFSSGLATVACREKRQRPLPRWGKQKGKGGRVAYRPRKRGWQRTGGLISKCWADLIVLYHFIPKTSLKMLFLPKPLDTLWTKFAQFPASDASKSSLKFSPPSQERSPPVSGLSERCLLRHSLPHASW